MSAIILNENIFGMIIPIVAIVGGVAIAIIAVVSSHAVKARQAELEAALKQDMLNRGMSAEEIQRVIEARPQGRK
jgi:hypothetical protein